MTSRRSIRTPRSIARSIIVFAAASLGFAVSLVLGGCQIAAKKPIPWDHWRPTYPDSYGVALADKEAKYWRHLLDRHLSPEGVLIFQRPDTPFDPSADDAYANLSDTPIWHGCFIAAAAHKYRVAPSEEVRRVLLHALDGAQFLSAVTGVSGLFARAISPAGRPVPDEDKDGEWHDAPPPHDAYRYRGDVSKDQYCGILFGYAAVTALFDLAHDRGDPELRKRIAPIVADVADHIWDNGFCIVDADGEPTKHGALSPYIFGVPVGIHAGLVLGFHELAARLNSDERFQIRIADLRARGYEHAFRIGKFGILGETNHNNDNMSLMGLFALTSLETDTGRREILDGYMDRHWRWIRYEGNVFWNNVYASRHPLPDHARVAIRENLRLYPVDHRVFNPDWIDHPLADRAFFDDRFDRPKNRTALPAHVRKRGGDFMWKNCPYALVDKSYRDGKTSASGVDYLLGYWMTRFYLGDPDRN